MTKRRKRRGPKPKPVPRTLTDRQRAFCREYLVDYVGVKAAGRAGYSKKSAKQQASRLLTIANVQTELARLAARVKAKTELSAVALLESVTAVALGDIRVLFENPDPHYEGAGPKPRSVLKDPRTLSHHEQFLIAGWKEQNGQVSELKLENRTRSKELLMKHLGLLKDHVRMEVASELTMEEEETISKMSDEDLATFRVANETVERLLHPEELA